MVKLSLSLTVCLAALAAPAAHPSLLPPTGVTGPSQPSASSSSSVLPDDPGSLHAGVVNHYPTTRVKLHVRPFTALAVAFTSGTSGLGIDVATPLATKINLRGSVSFFNYNPSLTASGIPINGTLKLRTIGAGIDIFPYRNTFHITPGVIMYNGNHATATSNIAPGSAFTLNDTDYISSPADPVHGTFDVNMGHTFNPSLTVGFGNMLRRDSHWSVPVDVGFQYIGNPRVALNLSGSTCQGGVCTAIGNDADTRANIVAEQEKIDTTISPLRFYPILKVGLSYRFGRVHRMDNWR